MVPATATIPVGVIPTAGEVRTVGVVGTGRMGTIMIRHLVGAGWPVTAYDEDGDALARAVAGGARRAGSPSEVAERSDLTLLVVVDDDQVRAVSSEIMELEPPPGSRILAICSSVRPGTCRDLAEAAAMRGLAVIDVALARGEAGAERAALLLFCGGPPQVLDACRPALSAFATDILHVGRVGSGQVTKTVNNVLLWACLRADVEALRLGRALGVEPSVLRFAVGLGSGANRPLEGWGEHRLRWPEKDLAVALALAEDVGLDVPLVRALAPLMEGLEVEDLEELR